MTLRIYLTGGVCVESGSVLVREERFPGLQGRVVFAMLAAEHRQPLGIDVLESELWGDTPPPASDSALRSSVSKLRTVLADVDLAGDALVHAFGIYQLRLPPDAWVDLEAAADAIHRAESALRQADLDNAVGWGRAAVSVAARPLLAGAEGPWVSERRERLRQLHLRALDCLAQVWLATGDAPQAARDAGEALRLDLFREPSHRLLMRALAATGDRAGALRAYENCRVTLADELGADPAAETEALYVQILRSD